LGKNGKQIVKIEGKNANNTKIAKKLKGKNVTPNEFFFKIIIIIPTLNT
jgi:hypothetical protein